VSSLLSLEGVLLPSAILGGLGLGFGLVLALAASRFRVEVDPRVSRVREVLPGINCGACGYPGCDGYAEAVVSGQAKPNLCAPGGADVAAAVASIMGISAEAMVKKVAFVRCKGSPDVARVKYFYDGVLDCREAVVVPGSGPKACPFGCLGFGTCAAVCPFGAIRIENGLARVESLLCTGCGICVSSCPKRVIELVPQDKAVRVACSSRHKGQDVKRVCQLGCIGCGLCARVCPEGAISIADNLPVVDFDKCTSCGACAQRCPTRSILMAF